MTVDELIDELMKYPGTAKAHVLDGFTPIKIQDVGLSTGGVCIIVRIDREQH